MPWRSVVLAGAAVLGAMVVSGGAAFAASSHTWATEQLAEKLTVPVTNPTDGVTYPTVLLVSGARLDSQRPDGTGASAPPNHLYLTLDLASEAQSHDFGDPLFGDYMAMMTPLPGSALTFRAANHVTYPALRFNPVNPNNQRDPSANDGLLDATYAFLVPDTVRSGTVTLSPSSTIGSEEDKWLSANEGGRPSLR